MVPHWGLAQLSYAVFAEPPQCMFEMALGNLKLLDKVLELICRTMLIANFANRLLNGQTTQFLSNFI